MTPDAFLFLRPDTGANPHTAGSLLCPLCGGQSIHIDDVYVAGRPREDGPVVPVHVDSSGRVDSRVELPIQDVGRRHAIALRGWCEICGDSFVIEFVQHKGDTLVAVRKPSWQGVEVYDPTTPDD